MLRKDVKEWLKAEQSHEKSLTSSGVRRAKHNRIRKTALKGFEDLTFLISNLPEKQQKQIFSVEKKEVRDFFETLFSSKIDAKDHEDYVRKKEAKELRLKRDRLLQLAAKALTVIGDFKFARAVLPEQLSPYVKAEFPPIRNLEYIITESYRSKPEN